MALHVFPIALGCVLVVAVGTILYTYMTTPQLKQHGYKRNNNYYNFPKQDSSSRASNILSVSNNDEHSSRKRKKSNSCTICLAPLQSNLKTLACDHVFHADCITPWLNFNSTCPLCREKVEV